MGAALRRVETSMQSVLIVIHILIVVALIAVVLLQRSEGGALGAGGGTGNFMTGRGQANALSRPTAILGALYFATALLMSILPSWSRAPHSVLQKAPRRRRPHGARADLARQYSRSAQADGRRVERARNAGFSACDRSRPCCAARSPDERPDGG